VITHAVVGWTYTTSGDVTVAIARIGRGTQKARLAAKRA
jgi:hypothetical protein